MPDWLARIIRTAIQVGLGTLVWAVVKVFFLRNITPEQDLAVLALLNGVSIVLVTAAQNAGENAGMIPTILKPSNADTAKVGSQS